MAMIWPFAMMDTRGHWAEQTIARVMKTGVMKGYPDGSFKPNRPLTRAEVVAILNRFLKRGPLYGVTTPSWSDGSKAEKRKSNSDANAFCCGEFLRNRRRFGMHRRQNKRKSCIDFSERPSAC
ncbi:S-layer homology domain-containing protein [Paenibacillus sp. MAHUQ-46]|uniref:S-layer homology domain-containing protein n=2 Tax=Paenibacillus TaxID=44249 RepID=A0A934IYK1_9BACL|nr:S-layer homology domain-containing protein [Paenibacillus roseus]